MKQKWHLLLISFLFIAISADAQKSSSIKSSPAPATKTKAKPVSTDSSSILIVMETQKAYQAIAIDEDGVLKLDKWPDNQITLSFPSSEYLKYSLQINKEDSLMTILSFSCSGKQHCKEIPLDALQEGKLLLTFKGKSIVAIGNQTVDISLAGKYPYLKLISNAESVTKQDDAKKSITGIYDALKRDSSELSVNVFMENETLNPELFFTPKAPEYSRSKRPCYTDTIKSMFNQLFLKSCVGGHRLTASATSLKYMLLIDARAGVSNNSSKVSFLKLKNRKSYEFYRVKKHLSPFAYREMQVNILCDQDSNYNMQRDDGRNLFVDGVDQFQQALQTQKNPVLNNADTTKKQLSQDDILKTLAFGKSLSRTNAAATAASEGQAGNNAKNEDFTSLPVSVQYLLTDMQNFPDRYKSDTIVIKNLLNDFKQSALKYYLADSAKNSLISKNGKKNEAKAAEYSRDLQLAQKKTKRAVEALLAYGYSNYARDTKKKLLSLSQAIKNFNTQYYTLDYNVAEWARDITMLKNKIIEEFKIPVTSNSADLARSLVRMIKNDQYISPMYYADFEDIIRTIEAQYKTINGKKATMKLVGIQIDVPNKDMFSLKVNEANEKAETIFHRDFLVSGGFQIDFSTGFFFTGIKNPEFNLVPTTFRYKETQTFTTSTGQDSVVYTGNVRDTSGNFIQRKGNRLTYGTGFMLHAYTRTGHFYNAGLATGILFNSSSGSNNFQVLLGGSLMLNAGATRVAISGGLCWGQETELTGYSKQYERNSTTSDNATIYPSVYDVPKFYPKLDYDVTSSWKTSYFIGVTFNFASATFGKK